jgi:hypothetical protein
MADELGKAVIIEVVDMWPSVYFFPWRAPFAVRISGLLERSRVYAADASQGHWV